MTTAERIATAQARLDEVRERMREYAAALDGLAVAARYIADVASTGRDNLQYSRAIMDDLLALPEVPGESGNDGKVGGLRLAPRRGLSVPEPPVPGEGEDTDPDGCCL